MKEIWKTIQNVNGDYEISSWGRVRRATPGPRTYVGRIRKAFPQKDGYLKVVLHRHSLAVHVLVARYFIGPCPPGKEVNHKDRNRTNNHYRNLDYRTHKANIRHALRNGALFRGSGEGLGNGKLKWAEVREIRKLYNTGLYTQRQLGERFGVTEMAIWQLVHGRTWQEKAA